MSWLSILYFYNCMQVFSVVFFVLFFKLTKRIIFKYLLVLITFGFLRLAIDLYRYGLGVYLSCICHDMLETRHAFDCCTSNF